jgi:hypothetical protein
MTDERQPQPVDPMAALQQLWPGVALTQSMMEQTTRVQATQAAEMLRKLNAPVVEALSRHRQLADDLAAAAEQVGAMAQQFERLARQHSELASQMQKAMEPYLRYVEWLGAVGAGKAPDVPTATKRRRRSTS